MTACPLCKGDVLDDAKKCKHCGEWLSRKHALRKGLLAAVPLIVFVVIVIALPKMIRRNSLQEQAQFQEHRGDLTIQDPTFHIADTDIPYVIGRLVNVGTIPWNSIVIRADFYDTAGRVFDTVDDRQNGGLYPADSCIIKILVWRPVLHARYDSFTIYIESAYDHRGPF